ncbi:MFS transporter [Paenalcaligenes niemegkensis]|uniref:MFS transporter n=1 Tax=Paenalcaligenes niemegkensis TaxID=2895469 RepID=UPI001EE81F62|nr:MFS transporter [Paenalcaligenes niemegkensis]MCQ9616168.1 MFS transporter [Paenalcaligenes niemegkensis]
MNPSISSTTTSSGTTPSSSLDSSTLLAIFSLAMGAFSIGTGEFVIMGLLPDAADDLGVSIPGAGHLISAYALGVVIGAPVLAVLGANWERKRLLIALMAAFAVANFFSSVAPGYLSMNVARFISGFPHGTYLGVAALVAAGMVPRHRRTQSVAWVLMGLTVATLIGVPIAAAIGQWFGWRSAFVIVGLLGLAALGCILRFVPKSAPQRRTHPLAELNSLKRPQVWLTLAIGAVGSGGLFAVFSYVKPTMMNLAGVGENTIPVILALFGIGMVGGNLVGAYLADKNLEATIRGILIWAFFVVGAFFFTAKHPILGSINILLVGTLVALGPALQSRLMDVAGDAQTLAAALNHSAFNAANALGAWLGGVGIAAGLGWASTGYIGASLAISGLLIHFVSLRLMRRHTHI